MTDTQNLLENRPPSLATHFLQRVEATPDKEAYRYPVPPASGRGPDEWRPLTWRESADRVFAIAAGLIALGIRPEERVALASSTRVEWILGDLGVLCAGAATTTVYPSTNAEETAFILADSGSRVLIAEDAAQLAKVREKRDELPDLAHVVVIEAEDATPAGDDPEGWVLSLAELEKRGAAHLDEHPDAVRERTDALRSDQLATLIYTSGTTGRPKGVRLAHDSWSYMAIAIGTQEGLLYPDDMQYLWLPLAHVFGKVLTAGQIYVGHTTAVDGRVDKIIENLPVVRPTYMCGVPRIFEKVYNGVAQKAREGGGAKYKIFQWAAGVARDYAKTSQDNFRRTGTASVPFGLKAQHAAADKLVYAKLREAFGGRLRAAVSGSAALAPEIGYFFAGAGINILEGYGLTESSAASFLNPPDYRTGTVGKAFPGTEVRFADDGEVLLRGPGIMEGYHGLPELTAQVLESDGWFHTGDIGELSPDGYLRITDRKKDLIKTSGGKYVAPAEVEGQFKAVCPFVSNILVHGSDRNYCTALIALDEPTIMGWAQEHGLAGKSYAEVVDTAAVRELIDGYVQRLNEGLQRWQTIKKFRLLPRDLDVEHGELTPSLKMKRPVVEREYKALIEDMYAGTREA
ncbi:AMP-dependent synthetase/ligase [Streptomyces sp. BRA346]|uniref:AMP-dependent synthetase/ligase n=1 Tax=Streptomyces sp. BRA346 TaxID=2878199 RepID=UPI0040647241